MPILAALALQVAEQPPARPGFQLLPQNENWSVLDSYEESDRTDWADPLKRIALDEAGDWRLSIGGRARFRIEGWNGFGFDAAAPARTDDVFWLGLAFLHFDLDFRDNTRLFIQGKSADVWDRELPGGSRRVDEDPLDLQQAFLQHRFDAGADGTLTIRLGRQMLAYGRQRLISPLPWVNVYRTWDGALASWKTDEWKTDFFATQFVPVDQNNFNDTGDDELIGAYATRTRNTESGKDVLDLYALSHQRGQAAFNGTAGSDRRFTVGFRHNQPPAAETIDHDIEFAYQFGELGSGDVSAWTLGSELGYKFEDAPITRLRGGLEIGSGDSNPGGNVQTFDPPYTLGHAYFGIVDAIGRQNAIDLYFGPQFELGRGNKAALTLHQFWRTERNDAVYNVAGGAYAATTGNTSRNVGQEIDLVVRRKVDQHWNLEFGYGHFFTATAIEAAGLNMDQDFIYAMATLAF